MIIVLVCLSEEFGPKFKEQRMKRMDPSHGLLGT